MPVALTTTQRRLRDFIRDYVAANGRSPSYSEMADGLGLKSKSGVFRILGELEARGAIVRGRNQTRSITIPPDEVVLSPGLSEALRRRFASPQAIEAAIRSGLEIPATGSI